MIKISDIDENTFSVSVIDEGSSTKHIVSLDEDYYHKLIKNKLNKKEIIRKSFKFLLEREPKESILSKFNLKIISDYFPEYEKEIKK